MVGCDVAVELRRDQPKSPQERRRETNGESLIKGLDQLLTDLERGKGELRISMTDTDAFELAVPTWLSTPGKVVYQNELMQLAPVRRRPPKTVAKRPLLIVPPWINKFYILDLQPKNSFIKWATDQGHTVFVIAWVNPDERRVGGVKAVRRLHARWPRLAALDAIEGRNRRGRPQSHRLLHRRYLNGGDAGLHGGTKAITRVKSATFFTTMVDFSEPGELGVFIDEEAACRASRHTWMRPGFLDGQYMSPGLQHDAR